ncbi:hypothetical protein EPUL_002049 [Erysiphe pulchra]|uniref:Reverse transcriptase domain-containing protein n=1 Tax=Erysiphe pulchra TaxID=225359 RepID=A0A2S4PR60_9PEZI|nr:hypothetical protein EPUL_002049 [Erysiphe pulchra]
MQANGGRSSDAHSIGLQIAKENVIDILLVQEPWILRDLESRSSISIPNFMTASPFTEWHTHQRVLTYVRKTPGLCPYQTAVDLSPYCIQISNSISRERKKGIWNVYNAPTICQGAGEDLKILLELSDSPEFVGGDFNLRNPICDSHIDRAREKDPCISNPMGTPSHNRGGTLDIAFCSLVGAKYEIMSEFNTTSDHETIVTIIPFCGDLVESNPKRLRYESLNELLFLTLLGCSLRRAKKAYWESCIEKSETLPDLFKITSWHNTSPNYQTPPLKGPSGIADVQFLKQKASLLHKKHPLFLEEPSLGNHSLSGETLRFTCQVTSSCPMEDEITASILRISWPVMGQRSTNLFNKCALLGTHPRVFKGAEIIIIPKPCKRNRSVPNTYRPISLLSCLGKGLEFLIARRLSYWVLKCNILAKDQRSAVSGCSATVLTTALLCDVKDAIAAGKIGGMVTTDVKGAFDRAQRNRLLNQLRSQG